jgi:predicted nucleic acid-binding Zn ribbon protein
MADEVDCSDNGDEITQSELARIRKLLASRELQPIGACHWCNEYVKGDKLFCSSECAEDWEHHRKYGGI